MKAHVGRNPRVCRERDQVAFDELASCRITIQVIDAPARRLEQRSGCGVDVESPGREDRHVPPLRDGGTWATAALEHYKGQITDSHVCGGRQPDRTGANDGDGKHLSDGHDLPPP
jgi:hypothetical protein